MAILLALIFLFFIGYNVRTVALFGLPASISETAYLYDAFCGKKWLFSLMCGLIGVGLLIPWLLITEDSLRFLPFLSCGCILFCAMTPTYRESFEGSIHYTFSGISFAAMILWFLLSGINLYVIALLAATIVMCIIIKPTSYVFFAELFAIGFLIAALFALYL